MEDDWLNGGLLGATHRLEEMCKVREAGSWIG